MSGSRAEDSTESNEPRGGMWGMLASIGPGIVVTGSVIGSGELINTPVQAATFGFILLWAVLLSCVIKYFLQVEIARHSLVENRTTFESINECPGPKFRGTSWIGLAYMAGYLITTLPIIGIIGALGGLMHDLWPLPTSRLIPSSLGDIQRAARRLPCSGAERMDILKRSSRFWSRDLASRSALVCF